MRIMASKSPLGWVHSDFDSGVFELVGFLGLKEGLKWQGLEGANDHPGNWY